MFRIKNFYSNGRGIAQLLAGENDFHFLRLEAQLRSDDLLDVLYVPLGLQVDGEGAARVRLHVNAQTARDGLFTEPEQL